MLFARIRAIRLAGLLAVGLLFTLAPARAADREIAIPTVTTAPKIDGQLDDACWTQAYSSSAFYPEGAETAPERAAPGTKLYLAHYRHTLLVAFSCRAVPERKGEGFVSIFLDGTRASRPLPGLDLYPEGRVDLRAGEDQTWLRGKGAYQSAVARAAGSWSVELSIDLTQLTYLRTSLRVLGIFAARTWIDGELVSRLVWAQSTTVDGEAKSEPGRESAWVVRAEGLDLGAVVAAIDEANARSPLTPRLSELQQQAQALLGNATRPPQTRAQALLAPIWGRHFASPQSMMVERWEARPERWEERVGTFARMLGLPPEGGAPRGAPQAALDNLAAQVPGAVVREAPFADRANPAGGQRYALGVTWAGVPLARVSALHFDTIGLARDWCAAQEADATTDATQIVTRRQGVFDTAYRRREGSDDRLLYLRQGKDVYEAPQAVAAGGQEALLEALTSAVATPATPLLDRLREQIPAPITVDDVARVLAFPLSKAVAVSPPSLGTLRVAGKSPVPDLVRSAAPLVVLGLSGDDARLRAAGFDPSPWEATPAVGHIATRNGAERQIVALWGRDRAGLERALAVFTDVRELLATRQALVGDLHFHTNLSDGTAPPLDALLAAIANGMDFAAITDHNAFKGSQEAWGWCSAHHVPFALVRGEEVTTSTFHAIALGLDRLVPPNEDARKATEAIHARGGLALLCHVGYPVVEAAPALFAQFDEIGFDGIDRWSATMAPFLDQRELVGRRPVLIEVTDSHDTTFSHLGRALVFATDATERGVLAALREGYCVGLGSRGVEGTPRLTDVTEALFAEGKYLAGQHRARYTARLNRLAEMWKQGGL